MEAIKDASFNDDPARLVAGRAAEEMTWQLAPPLSRWDINDDAHQRPWPCWHSICNTLTGPQGLLMPSD